jgi:hypothetical protein
VTIILLLGFVPGVWIAALLARARARLDRHRKTLARGRSWLEREAGESQAGAPVNTAGCWLSLLLGAISRVIWRQSVKGWLVSWGGYEGASDRI